MNVNVADMFPLLVARLPPAVIVALVVEMFSHVGIAPFVVDMRPTALIVPCVVMLPCDHTLQI